MHGRVRPGIETQLEEKLDTERSFGRQMGDRRTMRAQLNPDTGRLAGGRFGRSRKHRKHNGRECRSMYRCGLYKFSVQRWPCLAAILIMMALRSAVHRIAALHCLFQRGHRCAVEGISPQGKDHYRDQNWPGYTHGSLTLHRGPRGYVKHGCRVPILCAGFCATIISIGKLAMHREPACRRTLCIVCRDHPCRCRRPSGTIRGARSSFVTLMWGFPSQVLGRTMMLVSILTLF